MQTAGHFIKCVGRLAGETPDERVKKIEGDGANLSTTLFDQLGGAAQRFVMLPEVGRQFQCWFGMWVH